MQVNEQLNEDNAVRERHRQRIEQMRRDKERQMVLRRNIRKYAPVGAGVLAVLLLITAGTMIFPKKPADRQTDTVPTKQETMADNRGEGTKGTGLPGAGSDGENGTAVLSPMSRKIRILTGMLGAGEGEQVSFGAECVYEAAGQRSYGAAPAEDVFTVGEALSSGDVFYSKNAILIDLESNDIIAWKGARDRINPASMTKILTILVAAEQVGDLEDTFTITLDITDYSYVNGCSNAGFARDEEVTVRDLFYGTILPSGGDAALGLATYVAGSQEAFVGLMNQKLEELGLAGSAHVTNCVGLYDENHYCTVYDMAMILEAAMDNPLCREVLSTRTYGTSRTEQHPEGITISNWFLRRIEDHITGGEGLCAKTGDVVQSGNCAASYAQSADGRGFVCVTVGANSYWQCIFDHVGLYEQFFGGNDGHF